MFSWFKGEIILTSCKILLIIDSELKELLTIFSTLKSSKKRCLIIYTSANAPEHKKSTTSYFPLESLSTADLTFSMSIKSPNQYEQYSTTPPLPLDNFINELLDNLVLIPDDT